jgi:hypothetical protein
MDIDDIPEDLRIKLARAALAKSAELVCEEDSKLAAILVVTDGANLLIHPLRVTKKQAFSLLVAACTAVEPEEEDDMPDGARYLN